MIETLRSVKTGGGTIPLSQGTPTTSLSFEFTPPDEAKPYMPDILGAEKQYSLPKNLLPRLIEAESYFNPEAKSQAGAIGIAQIMPEHHPSVDPSDPKASIYYAAKHLRDLYNELGDWNMAIASYNAGKTTVLQRGMEDLPEETQNYLKKITGQMPKAVMPGTVSMVRTLRGLREKGKTTEVAEPALPIESFEQADLEDAAINSTLDYYKAKATPTGQEPAYQVAASALMARGGFGPQPTKIDEFGRPLNKEGEPIYAEKVNKRGFADQMIHMVGSLVSQPYEVVHGALDFALSMPAFVVGMIGAVGKFSSTIIDQVAATRKENVTLYGGEEGQAYVLHLDMNEAYDAAAKAMQESFEFFQPGKEFLLGKPTETSEMVGQIAMAPLSVLSYTGQKVAGMEIIKNYPNIQGLAKIAGDTAGILVMGMALRGRSRQTEFAEEVKEVTTEANDIIDNLKKASESPDALMRSVAEKKAQIDLQRLEAKAKRYAEKYGNDMEIVEELNRQAEDVAKAQIRPIAETGLPKYAPPEAKPEFQFTSKKGNKYFKTGKIWYDENGKEVTNPHRRGALERHKKPYGEEPAEPTVQVPEKFKSSGEAEEFGKAHPELAKELRARYDQGVEDIKKRTEEAGGDMDKLSQLGYDAGVNQFFREAAENAEGKAPKTSPREAKAKAKAEIKAEVKAKESKVTKLRKKPTPEPKFKPGDQVIAYGEGIPDKMLDLWVEIGDIPEGRVKEYRPILNRLRKWVRANYGVEGLRFFNQDFLEEYAKYKSMGEVPEGVADAYAFKHVIDKYGMPEEVKIAPKERGTVVKLKKGKGKEVPPVEEKPAPKKEYGKVDWFGEGEEVVKDVDRRTGEAVPELDEGGATYYQDKAKTESLAKIFRERSKQVQENVEVYLQKLINDVNRWYHGNDEVDIEGVRGKLSELASRADELRMQFMTGVDHLQFKETATNAAAWARTVERGKAVGKGVRLNMMIPLDEIPNIVKGWIKRYVERTQKNFKWPKQIKLAELRRNEELFRDTGFWLGRDNKWRFEISDDKSIFKEIKHLEERVKEKAESGQRVETTLGQIYEHPQLYNNFPELKATRVSIGIEEERLGSFDPNEGITLDYRLPAAWKTSVLVHEIQHYVNIKMGTFKGSSVKAQDALVIAERLDQLADHVRIGSKDLEEAIKEKMRTSARLMRSGDPAVSIDWFQQELLPVITEFSGNYGISAQDVSFLNLPTGGRYRYLRLPGEMESRLTSRRAGMTRDQRRKVPPWKSLDNMLVEEGIEKEAGLKLYSGLPVDEAARAMLDAARKVSDYVKQARGMKKFRPGEAADIVIKELNRSFIDRSGNIRGDLLETLGDEGYKIIQKMYLSKGANSRAAALLRQMSGEVYNGLSKDDIRILDTLILADRLIDISKYKDVSQFIKPKGITLEGLIAYREAFDMMEKLTPEQAVKITERAQAYFDWMKKPLGDLLEGGLISEKEYEDLMAHDYRKLESISDIFDRKHRITLGDKKRTIYDSGIESLQRGRETDIYEPSSEIMALEVFNRSYGRILNNEANRTLLDLARNDPENAFVRVKSKESKVPSGWNRIYVYENGERKSIYLEPEFSKEWITSSPEITYKLGQVIRWVTGAPVLRTFATGINWGFAVANLPRDIMHAWYTARVWEDGRWKNVYNSTAPVAMAQMSRDFAAVFRDSATRGKRYQDYIDEGGGMEFLVHQGRLFRRGRHIKGPMDSFFQFMGYFGETSEIMTRLAIRERVIRRRAMERGISMEEARKNKDITTEATFAARDYMDFGQGGGIAKALDNGLPYLNASIQGTRGLVRSFKPGSGTALASTYKLAQFAALVTGIYIAGHAMHPKTMKNLVGNIDMQNNLCIPLGDNFSFEDENGETRYIYFKIPLDPGQKFFKTFFEAATDKWLGNDVDVDGVVNSLEQVSPVGISQLPPVWSGTLGYMTNKDFWLNEDIWTKTDEPFTWPQSSEEYTPGRTPQFYIDVGKMTGLSPERSKYAVEELVTSGTIYSYILGKGYDEMLGELPKSQKEQHIAMVLAHMPVVKRFIGVTNPYSKHAQAIDEAEQQSVLKKFVENRGMDVLIDQHLIDGTATRGDIVKYARSFKDIDTYDRLMERYRWENAIKNLPEKSFWRRMKGLNTDAKAKLFVDRLKKSDEEEKKQLWIEYGIISRAGDVISDDFRSEVRRLRREALSEER